MRNFQVTIKPFMIEAKSLHEAKKIAISMIPKQNIEVDECMSVDSILNDMLGEEDAKLFMERLDSELDRDEGDNREPMPSYEEAQKRKEERRQQKT